MQPLAHAPRSFRDIVEADLRRAARLIIEVQDELDPQIRMATPEGDYHIAMTLPADAAGRCEALAALSTFMAWRQVLAFTFASELAEPECVFCCGISGTERHGCVAMITREPRPWRAENFGPVEWLSPESIDPALIALLPSGGRALTPAEVKACDAWFGQAGRFPALHVKSGEIRGI